MNAASHSLALVLWHAGAIDGLIAAARLGSTSSTRDVVACGVGSVPNALAEIANAFEALAAVHATGTHNIFVERGAFEERAVVCAIVKVEVVSIITVLPGVDNAVATESAVFAANVTIRQNCGWRVACFAEFRFDEAIAAAFGAPVFFGLAPEANFVVVAECR